MNQAVAEMISVFEPEKFFVINVPLKVLQRAFKLTTTEANILHTLLREYKSDLVKYKGNRQHVYILRNKLKKINDNAIVSFGLQFYAIPDEIKKKIVKHIIEQPGGIAEITMYHNDTSCATGAQSLGETSLT